MNNPDFQSYLESLKPIQLDAVNWQEGSFLLIAGPGSGKTRVLTARIAKIINDSPNKKFKVLALTFTNAAALEMAERLEKICPDYLDRAFVGTFHSFCGEILRQHGVHIKIKPDFGVLSDDRDRSRILKKILTRKEFQGMIQELWDEDIDLLPIIDRLKSKLIGPNLVHKEVSDQALAKITAAAYKEYDKELNKQNILDFSSIIYYAYYLIRKYPAIAKSIRSTYKYWLIDEFQDTNFTQYQIIKTLAGESFFNIFVVADDDQIIYQWNGASYQRIEDYSNDFSPETLQLPVNYRCPKEIVEIANELIVNNTFRHSQKKPLKAEKTSGSSNDVITMLHAKDELDEIELICNEISSLNCSESEIAVLARNKYLLEPLKEELIIKGIKAVILQKRSDFITNTFQTMYLLIKLSTRRQDDDVLHDVIEGIKYSTGIDLFTDDVIARADAEKIDFFNALLLELDRQFPDETKVTEIVKLLTELKLDKIKPDKFFDSYIEITEEDVSDENQDFLEDQAAWKKLNREIKQSVGKNLPLERFMQELDMRSKEPPLADDEISLMTIHASKGREYNYVFLMGMADSVLPSWQALKKGASSTEVEEERRNCFVAITRTKMRLFLSYADSYRGWHKEPSRFLTEMGLVAN